jgi:hypothetical protein
VLWPSGVWMLVQNNRAGNERDLHQSRSREPVNELDMSQLLPLLTYRAIATFFIICIFLLYAE